MSGADMTNNSMEDVASKFGNNWGRLAAVIVIWRNPVKFHRVPVQNKFEINCLQSRIC